MKKKSAPKNITAALLRRWRLPDPDSLGDKEDRGSVLVVGGASEMPGAVILAATAALRAGAGKLQIATNRSSATAVAAAVPEARVFALKENKSGAITPAAADDILERANRVKSLLIGPGMIDETLVSRLMTSLVPRLDGPVTVLDATALALLKDKPDALVALKERVILTPHAGELAGVLGIEKKEIEKNAADVALRTAADFKAVVALKGAETLICHPHGDIYCNRTGNIGLATSGSGDTLSGIIAGLAARGAHPLQAAVWGVYLHGRAGERLARQMGLIGFLARELLEQVPPVMAEVTGGRK